MLDRHVPKISENDYYLCHVCPSVRMEQLGFHCSDVLEIRCLSIYRKFIEKIRVSLKSDKNNGVPYIEIYIRLWWYLA